MKKLFLMCISCLVIYSITVAQSTVDKTVNKANEGLIKAGNAKNTFDKLKGWLPKRKKKAEDTSAVVTAPMKDIPIVDSSKRAAGNVTQVSISNIDYPMLKKLNENIQACDGVLSTKLKFGVPISTIDIIHSGTTEKLLQLMQASSSDIFTSKQLQAIEEGKISIKI